MDVRAAAITLAGQFVDGEEIERKEQTAQTQWEELVTGQRKLVYVEQPSSGDMAITVQPQLVFPGAFNPRHAGHRRMAELASQRLGEPVTFEISVTNVDKPMLDYVEIDSRVTAFQADGPGDRLVLTDARTFREKSGLFPGCTFVVGADTIRRIAQPRYYVGGEVQCEEAIREIADLRCRFLVFGREEEGRFKGLDDLNLPTDLRAICEGVEEEEFREDVSSTELRAKAERA